MTDKETMKLALEALRMPCNYWNKTQFIKVQEAIAAVEKALAQPEQEPVAWRTYTGRGYYIIDPTFEDAQKNWPDKQHQPLYTHPPQRTEPFFKFRECEDSQAGTVAPPQRTWVGLTDEERDEIALEIPIDAVCITEAKLKEKNT